MHELNLVIRVTSSRKIINIQGSEEEVVCDIVWMSSCVISYSLGESWVCTFGEDIWVLEP